MANDCITKYYFDGPKKDIIAFAKKLVEWISMTPTKLREPVYIDEVIDKDSLNIGFDSLLYNANLYDRVYWDTRGEMFNCNAKKVLKETSNEHPLLYLETDTAWSEYNDIWYSMLDKYFPNIVFYYYAKQPGAQYCSTNDIHKKFFKFDYHLTRYYSPDEVTKDIEKKYQIFYEIEDWSEEDLFYTLRKILNQPNYSLAQLKAIADSEYHLRFNKVAYNIPNVEKKTILRKQRFWMCQRTEQNINTSFFVQVDKKTYPYLIKLSAEHKAEEGFGLSEPNCYFYGQILYDNRIILDNFHVVSNLNVNTTDYIRDKAKEISKIIQTRLYDNLIFRDHFRINITDIIDNILISIEETPLHKLKINIKCPFDVDDERLPDEFFNLEVSNITYFNNRQSAYHILCLLIYALLDIPDDDFDNITIEEPDFLK